MKNQYFNRNSIQELLCRLRSYKIKARLTLVVFATAGISTMSAHAEYPYSVRAPNRMPPSAWTAQPEVVYPSRYRRTVQSSPTVNRIYMWPEYWSPPSQQFVSQETQGFQWNPPMAPIESPIPVEQSLPVESHPHSIPLIPPQDPVPNSGEYSPTPEKSLPPPPQNSSELDLLRDTSPVPPPPAVPMPAAFIPVTPIPAIPTVAPPIVAQQGNSEGTHRDSIFPENGFLALPVTHRQSFHNVEEIPLPEVSEQSSATQIERNSPWTRQSTVNLDQKKAPLAPVSQTRWRSYLDFPTEHQVPQSTTRTPSGPTGAGQLQSNISARHQKTNLIGNPPDDSKEPPNSWPHIVPREARPASVHNRPVEPIAKMVAPTPQFLQSFQTEDQYQGKVIEPATFLIHGNNDILGVDAFSNPPIVPTQPQQHPRRQTLTKKMMRIFGRTSPPVEDSDP